MRRAVVWSVAGALAVVCGGVLGARSLRVDLGVPPAVVNAGTSPTRAAAFSERTQRDTQIIVWNRALAADPVSALALGQLAALHLQRAREGGAWDDYLQAEVLARRSLALRTHRNAPTAVTLTQALLAQHRFTEAYAVAEALVAAHAEPPEYRALLGEVAMELGRDSVAAAAFSYVWSARRNLSVAPRLARWLEITNQLPKARAVIRAARDEAVARRDVAREAKAWFQMRVGDIERRAGNHRAAAQAYRAGLVIEPADPRLMAAMARLADELQRPDDVITWAEQALAVQLEPGTLGLLATAYAARGDTAKATEYEQVLEVIAEGQPGPYHRAWGLFLLDRGRRIDEVMAGALQDLASRQDVYGYDLAAWALFQAGRIGEARTMMAKATRFGTRDPQLRAHAAAIAAAHPRIALVR